MESGQEPRPVMLCRANSQKPEWRGQIMGDIPCDIMGKGGGRLEIGAGSIRVNPG